MEQFDIIVVGSGLAGLTTALELSESGKSVIVLEKSKVIGGRTASWDDDGMLVESGFHRHIGYYEALPKVLKKVGVEVDKIVQWEEQIDIRIKGRNKKNHLVFHRFMVLLKLLKVLLATMIFSHLRTSFHSLIFSLMVSYNIKRIPENWTNIV